MKATDVQLFEMVMNTNKKVLNAMYSGDNEEFKVESKNFNAQYSEVLKRDLVEEYRTYCKKVV